MRILLINPVRDHKKVYIALPNLGLGYLASALRKKGYYVEIWDMIKEKNGDRFFKNLKNNKFDIIGIQVYTNTLGSTKRLINIIKNINPESILVVGGPHPSGEPEQTFSYLSDINYLFKGEGEVGFPELVETLEKNKEEDIERLKKIPNLIFYKDGRFNINHSEIIQDLDLLEFPAWDLINPKEYPLAPNGMFIKSYPISPFIISRGCPFSCGFCAGSSLMGKKVRYRSADNILNELRLLSSKFAVKEIQIMDDNFTANREKAKNILEKIAQSNLKVYFSCPNGIRIDTLDEEIIALMEKANFYSISLGIESGSPRILSLMDKRLDLKIVQEKLSQIKKKSKIRVTGFFILGYPGEEEEDIKKTIKFSLQPNLDRASYSLFQPLPGSPIYEKLKKEKNFIFNFDNFDFYNPVFSPDNISLKRLKRWQKVAYLRFYLRIKILRKIIKEIKSFSQLKFLWRRITLIIK